ncbi:PaaI family thioesterase [Alsobacter sp. KACC 23698]|uniref:PaaI family thioesterase n=1 Tax=Alsobacter sp. KACC 23698 TaxID=3149229 RepID=A0AAU7JMD7_9HYPH
MNDTAASAVMTVRELETFLEREFPEMYSHGRIWHVLAIPHHGARLRMDYHPSQLRPGGTISGPAMMTLADFALYAAVLGAIGPVGLAVTTNLSINFLRKPEPRALLAECRLLKLGKRLAVGEVTITSEGSDEPVAHVTGTYSIPPC